MSESIAKSLSQYLDYEARKNGARKARKIKAAKFKAVQTKRKEWLASKATHKD